MTLHERASVPLPPRHLSTLPADHVSWLSLSHTLISKPAPLGRWRCRADESRIQVFQPTPSSACSSCRHASARVTVAERADGGTGTSSAAPSADGAPGRQSS
jgi:hypothetical protein